MTRKSIARLEAEIAEPSKGLAYDVFLFASRITPMINVDLLIQKGGKTLLTWREDCYGEPGWHIPGGIVRYKETLGDRILKTALAELGAAVKYAASPLAVTEFIHPSRKDRGHSISLLYRCLLTSGPDKARKYKSGPPKPGQWAWLGKCPENLLPTHEVYRRYI